MVYLYKKCDYKSMRKDAFDFAKEKYFNGYPDTCSVQENFNLITSFIRDSADKHIPSKASRTVSPVPWISSELRRKIRRRNKAHAKAKKTSGKKLRSKFETLRREIKDDVRKQHDLYVNNLIGDVKVIVGHIFETSIKCLCFIRSQWNFVCMFFKAFWTQLNKFRGKICILKTDFILQTCVNFWPINSKIETYTSYYKIWGI